MKNPAIKAVRRASRVVDVATREAAVDTVLAAMEAGRSFSAASAGVAKQVGVNESTVRMWVNASGRRPEATWTDVASLRAALAEATDLNRRMAERLDDQRLDIPGQRDITS